METGASSSTPSSALEIFTVYARETAFRLSRSQIETDSPNYFTSAFLSHDFAESSTREIFTDKNPQLFALIVEHLSGYGILPLQPSAVPPTMSIETAKENLLRDAKYFGLEQLQELLSPKTTLEALPEAVSSVCGVGKIYPLDRLTIGGGDLTLDTKVHRPFVLADPLPLVVYFRTDTKSVVKIGDDVFRLQQLAQALAQQENYDSDGVFRNWEWLKTPLTFLEEEEEELTKSTEVVADVAVLSLQASDQSGGFYTAARATLVYAELRTTEEWTKNVLAPAIAASTAR
ncbi:hypothetical protein JCM5350_007639 [Sporobolomyces pararoseus]